MLQAPKPEIAYDPALATEQAQAKAKLIDGLKTQTQADTANLMSIYGTRLALSGAGMTTLVAGGT